MKYFSTRHRNWAVLFVTIMTLLVTYQIKANPTSPDVNVLCDDYSPAVPIMEIVDGEAVEIFPTLNYFSDFSVIENEGQLMLWLNDQANSIDFPRDGSDFRYTSEDGVTWQGRVEMTPKIDNYNGYVRSMGIHEVQLIDGVYHAWRDYLSENYVHNGQYGWANALQYMTSTNGTEWTIEAQPALIGNRHSNVLLEDGIFHMWSRLDFDKQIFRDEPETYRYRTSSDPGSGWGDWYDGGQLLLIDDLPVDGRMRVRWGLDSRFEAFHRMLDSDAIYRATSSDGVSFTTQESIICLSDILPDNAFFSNFDVVNMNGEDWFFILYRGGLPIDGHLPVHIAVSKPVAPTSIALRETDASLTFSWWVIGLTGIGLMSTTLISTRHYDSMFGDDASRL